LPPSAGATRPYEIIRGTLADLDNLPVARMPEDVARLVARPVVTKGRRNGELFNYCKSIVSYCDALDQLIDAAKTWAECCTPPLPDAEIVKTCNSVWQYRGGRRRIMDQIVEAPEFAALVANTDALALFAFLSAENRDAAEFMIADGLAKRNGWPLRFVPSARKALLDLGLVERVRRPRKNAPALYRWRRPTSPGQNFRPRDSAR
jgi:hypothetical protein